jgi:hypothetical protein
MDSDADRKPGKLRRLSRWLSSVWEGLLPGARVRQGAAAGIIAAALVCAVFFGIFLRPGLPGFLDPLAGVVFFLVMAVLMGLLFWLAYRLLLILPRFLSTLGMVAFVVLVYSLADVGVGSPLNILIGVALAAEKGIRDPVCGGAPGFVFRPCDLDDGAGEHGKPGRAACSREPAGGPLRAQSRPPGPAHGAVPDLRER